MLDTLIKNALILDGTGKRAYPGSVGIKQGKLVLDGVHARTPALRVIDAKCRYLAPGFIDAHSHGDLSFHKAFSMEAKLSQGITTQVAGQCGESVFPCDPAHLTEYHEICKFSCDQPPKDWDGFTSMQRFLETLDKTPLSLNLACFVGHNSLRAAAIGFENRSPNQEELQKMCALLEEAMQHGAMGLSSGLMYMPGCFSDYEEMRALVKVVAKYNGIYVTHMRDEADRVIDSVKETLSIGRDTGARVWISHHKVSGRDNWGKSRETLALVDAALKEGINVMLDQYPFAASMTGLDACFPQERIMVGVDKFIADLKNPAFRQTVIQEMNQKGKYENTFRNAGSFHRIQISGSKMEPEAEGLRVDDYAKKIGKDPYDVLFDLYTVNHGAINGVYYTMDEADVQRIFMHPRTVIGTDGITRSEGEKTHPRAYASFPQAINYFVKQCKLLPLEACIAKGTSRTADALGFATKGRIAEGMDADLVLFDYELLTNCANFENPSRPCDGILKVLVNGEIAYENAAMTAAREGRFLARES